jgi:oligosaccharide reducing-end xylanase
MPASYLTEVALRHGALAVVVVAATCLASCGVTSDSLGRNDSAAASERHLLPLKGPSTYPNGLRDLGVAQDPQILSKIDGAFNQLFHGNLATEAIFFPVGNDEANIQDIHHSNEVRTEGMGLAMLIAVELGKQDEFNQLWRYAKAELMETAPPKRGYFKSYCDNSYNDTSQPVRCWDPYGMQLFVTALIFAHDRWSSGDAGDAGAIDYESDVFMILDTMRYKQQENGGIVGGVTNTFDDATHLVYGDPTNGPSSFTRPSAEMPAFYELWAQATGDPYWSAAAASARSYWKSAANPNTGMLPVRAYFSGAAYPGWDVFAPEGYRTQLNMVLDKIWFDREPWEVSEADQLIGFFAARYPNLQFPKIFKTDGTVIDNTTGDSALVVLNGMSALISTNPNRQAFVTAAWNQPLQTGEYRYYGGLLNVIALMVLGGQFRVY